MVGILLRQVALLAWVELPVATRRLATIGDAARHLLLTVVRDQALHTLVRGGIAYWRRRLGGALRRARAFDTLVIAAHASDPGGAATHPFEIAGFAQFATAIYQVN